MYTIERLNKLCISQLILVQGCAFYNPNLNPEYIGKVWAFLIDTHINKSNFINNWTLYLNFDVFYWWFGVFFGISVYQNCLISCLTFFLIPYLMSTVKKSVTISKYFKARRLWKTKNLYLNITSIICCGKLSMLHIS